MGKKKILCFIIFILIIFTIVTIFAVRSINISKSEEIDEWNEEKLVNSPKLSVGMTPIIYGENGEAVEVESNEDWYDYKVQETATQTGGDSQWANAQTKDGSQWVWIPRYEYKIFYYDVEHKEN